VKLSVVVVTTGDTPVSRRCLANLQELTHWPPIECIVVTSDDALAGARGRGLGQASGDVVAFLNERYRVPQDWARTIIEAHGRQDAEVIGGCISSPTRNDAGARAIFLWEYSQANCIRTGGPLRRAEALALPGGNISYKRSVFSLVEVSNFFWEIDFHASLCDHGVRFRCEPAMSAGYEPPQPGEFLVERFRLSRDWARVRAFGLTPLRRYASGVARVALPAILLYRIARRTHPPRQPLWGWLACVPFFLGFAMVETAGEIAGWFGTSRNSTDRLKTPA